MSEPKKFIKLELYVESGTVYEAEENVRALLHEHGFEEGETFWIEDSGDVLA